MIRKTTTFLNPNLSRVDMVSTDMLGFAKSAMSTVTDLLLELSRWPVKEDGAGDYSTPSAAFTRIGEVLREGEVGISISIELIDDLFRAAQTSHRIEVVMDHEDQSILADVRFFRKAERVPFGEIHFVFYGPGKKNLVSAMCGGDFERQPPKYALADGGLFVGNLTAGEVVRAMRGMVPRSPRTGIL